MRNVILLICGVLGQSVAAEVTLNMWMDDKIVGSATINQRLLPDGGKQLTMQMAFTGSKTPVSIRNESVYAGDGTPVRMIYEFAQQNAPKNLVTATFNETGASVIVKNGTETKSRTIARPEGTVKNSAEFWFIATKPKVGDKVSAYVFSAVELEYRLHTSTYGGRKTVTIDGQKFEGHLLTSGTRGKEVKSIVDDRGLPLIVEGPIRLVRKVGPGK